MTSPDTLFADRDGITTASGILRGAAEQLASVDGAALDSGIAGALPGSATAQSLLDASAAVDRAAAALSDRAARLGEECRIALAHLDRTDEDFARTLRDAVAPAAPAGTATPSGATTR